MLPGAEKRRGGRRGGGLRRAAAAAAAFALYSLRRFVADGCFAAAGALSYTALVSLVPLAAIALGSLSVFPIFGQLHDQILGLVFKYFIPSIGEQAGWWFRASPIPRRKRPRSGSSASPPPGFCCWSRSRISST